MDNAPETFIKLSGKQPGPASMILVGVHGNETCGIEALETLLPNLVIESGTLLIVYGNPRAIEQGVRFTEQNLNRMFVPEEELSEAQKNSYEFRRAQSLKSIFAEVDVLLDIHASNNPNSKPFIICEGNSDEITSRLPISTIVHGFDQIEPGGTDYYMNKIGKIGICVESGYINDQSSVEIAVDSIMKFLKTRGHIHGETTKQKQERFRMFHLYKTESDSFKLERQFADFEQLNDGQKIGTDGTKAVSAPKDCTILFAKNLTEPGQEAFLLGEKIK